MQTVVALELLPSPEQAALLRETTWHAGAAVIALRAPSASVEHITRAAVKRRIDTERTLVAVNPGGTTQDCSSCGAYVPKKLSDRWHTCACGLSISRDLNAALNIQRLAIGLGWSHQAIAVEAARAVA